MKRLLIILVAVALLLGLAWLAPHSLFSVIVATPTPPLPTVDAAASTPTAEALPLPENIQVSYENVSFAIPAGLATGADGQTGAATQAQPGYSNAFDAPAFIQLTLQGYPFPASSGYPKPEVRIYPAAEYAQVSGWAAESLKRLQNVLANPSAPLENASLPNVPFMGSAAQLYAAQAQLMAFKNGNGVRMISSYAQYPAPVSRYDSFYHYEGLTRDGKYWVVVTMPVGLPVYSDASNPGENGITYPNYQTWADVEPYYTAMTNLLNAASPEGFNPMLGQLDALVQSITVGEVPASLSATPQSGTPCPSLLAGTELLTDTAEGYCLLYPAGYSNAMAHYIVINPVNAPGGDMPGDAWLSITVESAVGRTATQVAEAQIAVVGAGFNITTIPLMIDNEPAVVIDGLPGQDSTRKVLIVHADRLYTLTFTPWYPSPAGAAQLTPLEDLYTLVTQTFRFLP